jgi:uncharacterized protein YggE
MVMKFFLLTLSTLIVFSVFGQNGSKNFIDQHYIEITGDAELEIAPNQFFIKIILKEKDFESKEKFDELEDAMLKKLGLIGIDISKDIGIKDHLSNFKSYWQDSDPSKSAIEYELVVDDASKAMRVITNLESIGVSDVSIDGVANTELASYQSQVKVKAIQNAREKASSIARAINQNVGKAIYIKEVEGQLFSSRKSSVNSIVIIKGLDSPNPALNPNFELKTIRISYSVIARFELN